MLETLRERSPEAIMGSLTGGTMLLQGQELTVLERHAVAAFITGRAASADALGTTAGRCESTAPLSALLDGPHWSGWGADIRNHRAQPAAVAGLAAGDVPNLTLRWAFAFPDTTAAWAQPAVAGGRLFVGSQNGVIYALDAQTGCSHWTYLARGSVRTAVSIGRDDRGGYVLYFGDTAARVYALDAATGAERWVRDIEDHAAARITGAPTLHEGRLYVPVSSIEEALAASPAYACCSFRGSVVALDAATGDVIWKSFTAAEGEAGAAIWSSPAIDTARGLLYAATGNAYTTPASPSSDAIAALDLASGARRWTAQLTPGDSYVMGCEGPNPNCPDQPGPDHDFGASPALITLADGRDLIVVGQKSGMTYALDPDRDGAVVWEHRVGQGGALGGIEWGFAVEDDVGFFAVSDMISPQPGGLVAVDLTSGERAWRAVPPPPLCAAAGASTGFLSGCDASLGGAVTAIPGVVFSGSNDGGLRAHAAGTGKVIWTFDTNRPFETVNGVPGAGGSINAAGPVVVDGMVYANSGYAFIGSRAGNVLLAFGVE